MCSTISPVVVEDMDPFFIETGILNLKKLVHGSYDVIISDKMANTHILLHLWEEVVVQDVKSGDWDRCWDQFKSSFLGWLNKDWIHFFKMVLIYNYPKQNKMQN